MHLKQLYFLSVIMQLKRKVKTSAAISVSAARGTYEALGAKKGKAEGGSKAPSIPSTRVIQLL